MPTDALDPIVSEFAALADAYERWFRVKVATSLDDPRRSVPHDEAMARLDATLVAVAGTKMPA